ncbi:hypothetical protein [Candidatus Neptunochlamydia vexilliferae]|nr:hypothetical protein [Candidatus Neptunochlamydia vexilliferae]
MSSKQLNICPTFDDLYGTVLLAKKLTEQQSQIETHDDKDFIEKCLKNKEIDTLKLLKKANKIEPLTDKDKTELTKNTNEISAILNHLNSKKQPKK